jgi:RNA polymerase sigma-70 factor, ECF subfamily
LTEEAEKIEALLEEAARGTSGAWDRLLGDHRERLRRMVALRLDRRITARVDASDVVQEALADAVRHRDDYLKRRPVPFYPWLRQFAWERLVDVQRYHLNALRRTVTREQADDLPLPDRSAVALVDRLMDEGTSPSGQMIREERRRELHAALEKLPARDRDILVMRYLEQLTSSEIAAVLGVREGAMKMRLLRAMERLRALLAVMEKSGSQ